MTTIDPSTAENLILALRELGAYESMADDAAAALLADSLQEETFISLTVDDAGNVSIGFELSRDLSIGSAQLFSEIASFGYEVAPHPEGFNGFNYLITKKVLPMNAPVRTSATPEEILANSQAVAERLAELTASANASSQTLISATEKLNVIVGDAMNVEKAVTGATQTAEQMRESLLGAMGNNGARAAAAASTDKPAKKWLTSKPVKIGGAVAGVALLGTGVVMGLRHYGVPIPFLDKEATPASV